MVKKNEKNNKGAKLITLVINLFVIGFALFYIGINIAHVISLRQVANINISSTASYEEFIKDYNKLKLNLIKLNASEYVGKIEKTYYNDLVNHLMNVSSSFGKFQLQPYLSKSTLSIRNIYIIEQSAIKILKGETLSSTIKYLEKSDVICNCMKKKFEDLALNREAYMSDVNAVNLEKFYKYNILGFDTNYVSSSIEPIYIKTMNNMILAIKDYVILSDILIEGVRSDDK